MVQEVFMNSDVDVIVDVIDEDGLANNSWGEDEVHEIREQFSAMEAEVKSMRQIL